MPHFLGNVVDVAYRQFLALHELVHNAHDVATNQKHGLPGRRIETGVHLNGSQQLSERNNLSRSINPDILLTAGQAKAIRIVSCILAGTSLLATMLAFYWFSRMRRRFRHKYDSEVEMRWQLTNVVQVLSWVSSSAICRDHSGCASLVSSTLHWRVIIRSRQTQASARPRGFSYSLASNKPVRELLPGH